MKVLIADRSIEIRQRLKRLVLGIYDRPKIFETNSKIEAISIVEIQRPDLVITDIDLYNGSGLSLLSFLSNDSSTLKIVFTNHIKYNLEEISRKLGADYFLSKAHDFIQIKQILNNDSNSTNQMTN